MKILKINSSIQTEKSVGRKLVDQTVSRFTDNVNNVIERDLAMGLPLLTQDMVNAFYTPEDAHTDNQKEELVLSNLLIKEIEDSEIIIMGIPIYNFGVPASVKAYFDLIARVGVTFKYTDKGPVGLFENKKVYVIITSGGTPFMSDTDFASAYIKHFLGFLGISDVNFISADQLVKSSEIQIENAKKQITELVQ
jgi:FMN-dependent NADH-azoreductase